MAVSRGNEFLQKQMTGSEPGDLSDKALPVQFSIFWKEKKSKTQSQFK